MMLAIDNEAKDHEKIVSTSTGWSDEHIHTELLTSEGMNRVWSFQRSLINGMVTARDGDEVVSYRMRHGGEGGLEVIESCDLGEMGEMQEFLHSDSLVLSAHLLVKCLL